MTETKGKILQLAVMAYLLSGVYALSVCGAEPNPALPSDATATVDGNYSSENNRYHSITLVGTNQEKMYGINNATNADMTVYLRDDFTKLSITDNSTSIFRSEITGIQNFRNNIKKK